MRLIKYGFGLLAFVLSLAAIGCSGGKSEDKECVLDDTMIVKGTFKNAVDATAACKVGLDKIEMAGVSCYSENLLLQCGTEQVYCFDLFDEAGQTRAMLTGLYDAGNTCEMVPFK